MAYVMPDADVQLWGQPGWTEGPGTERDHPGRVRGPASGPGWNSGVRGGPREQVLALQDVLTSSAAVLLPLASALAACFLLPEPVLFPAPRIRSFRPQLTGLPGSSWTR